MQKIKLAKKNSPTLICELRHKLKRYCNAHLNKYVHHSWPQLSVRIKICRILYGSGDRCPSISKKSDFLQCVFFRDPKNLETCGCGQNGSITGT